MAADVRAFIELMRPKNMVLAAITVPLGALFGLNATLNSEQITSVAVQVLAVLTFMGAGNAMNDIKDAEIDAQAHLQIRFERHLPVLEQRSLDHSSP